MTWPRPVEIDGLRTERRHVELIGKPHYPEMEQFGETYIRVKDVRAPHAESELKVKIEVAADMAVGERFFISRSWIDKA